jgi:O-acetyl-ADP-ribose deacetylase (regulator of RNase III)
MVLHESVNPYLAARAALLLVRFANFRTGTYQGQRVGDLVQTVAFPGLGTGVGRVPSAVCARQVRAALDEALEWPRAMPRSWADASEQHQLLYTDRPKRLQHKE